jgi:hypothetical protein
LPRFVELSNRGAREFDVSLDPHGGRKIFSKITARGKLRDWWRAEAKLGEFG